nr:PREDICTED: E3 ubiquitin-protein ligase NEURL3-like [Bemisia tabaci]
MMWVRKSVIQRSYVPYASTVPMIKIQEWLVKAHEDPSNPENFTPPFPQVPVDPNDAPWRNFDQGTVCCVCRERRSNTELSPCRHIETCMTCTRRIHATTSAYNVPFKCPMCRSRVTGFSRVSDVSQNEGK